MSTIKRICICAICIALCYVLPLALHPIGMGQILSPMHLPVLLCGLICGWYYGAICGIIGPILASMLSGKPPVSMLMSMIPELCIYGIVCGILMKLIRSRHTYIDLYAAMIPAMILGRIVGGLAKYILYVAGKSDSGITIATWVSSYIVGTFPGIIVQLLLIPTLVFVLMKAHLIPDRYPKDRLQKA